MYRGGKKRREGGLPLGGPISTIAADAHAHAHAQVKTYTADNGAALRPLGAHAHYNKVRARRLRATLHYPTARTLILHTDTIIIDTHC